MAYQRQRKLAKMKKSIKADKTFVESFGEFERQIAGKEPEWLTSIRKTALSKFEKNGIPTTRHEDWRYTKLDLLTETPFNIGQRALNDDKTNNTIKRIAHLDSGSHSAVFINGFYVPAYSRKGFLPEGVILCSLKEAIEKHPVLVKSNLASYVNSDDYSFPALNTAFMSDGLFLYIAAGQKVEEPIHLIFITASESENIATYPRNLIIAEENAEAIIVESHHGINDKSCFTNAVTEVLCKANSHIHHYKIQKESKEAFHFATTDYQQETGSKLTSFQVTFGGRLTRNDMFTTLNGEDAESTVKGLYLCSGDQHVDNFTRMKHVAANCRSRQLFKGILGDRSHGVFDGRIHVLKGAQKTDAVQTSRSLLLSDDAVVNAKPQLEIYADDVKCTHGSTTGQLDEDQLFYLRSRGFELNKAKALLTYAFAGELVEEIEIESVKDIIKGEFVQLVS